MSKNFRVRDGDLYIDEFVGKTEFVSGPAKLAQDAIEEFLTNYDPEKNRGTKIRNLNQKDLIRQEIAETIDRLRSRQRTNQSLDVREEIDSVRRIIVQSYDGINIIFFVEFICVSGDLKQVLLVKDSKGALFVEEDSAGNINRSSGAASVNQQLLPGFPV